MSSKKKRKIEYDIWLDRLPIEILLEIFEYLSSNDIIYAFFNFNQRMNKLIIQQQQRWLNTFTFPTSDLDYWIPILTIIGSQIQTLNIINDEISIPLHLFSNLKCIIISSRYFINYKLLDLITTSTQFQTIKSLKIKTKILFEGDKYSFTENIENLFHKMFNNVNTLETFECYTSIPRINSLYNHINIYSFYENVTVHSLTLKLTNFNLSFSIIDQTPNLTYLNITSQSPYNDDDFRDDLDWKNHLEEYLIYHKSLKKLYLTFIDEEEWRHYCGTNTLRIVHFIKQFSSLECLSFNILKMKYIIEKQVRDFGPTYPFDAITLQKELLESLIYLKEFHFYATLDKCGHHPDILSTFKNQFWLDHNWFIGMHNDYLYTLPFQFEDLYEFDFDFIKSTNDDMLINNHKMWYNVTSIELAITPAIDINLLKSLKIKMPKLTSIKIKKYCFKTWQRGHDCQHCWDEKSTESINKDKPVILDNVTTISLEIFPLQYERDWIINSLPNIKHCISHSHEWKSPTDELIRILNKIEKLHITNDDIDDLIEKSFIYFLNIKYIKITISWGDEDNLSQWWTNLIIQLLIKFKNLQILLIHIPNKYSKIKNLDLGIELYRIGQILCTNEISKDYSMKILYNHLQLSKNTL